MNKIEILAPAGSYEGMKAAMNAGCDAVYIGGSSFGARAYADNLNEDTLLQAIDEAHIRDKKIYLTVNTLLKEKELTSKLYTYLEKCYLQGLDAVIVQDVGVMHFIHNNFPDLPIHASTQMTLTMAQGAKLLSNYGVTRLVTSRELSFKEIKTISDNTNLEIETFVHGALCYCYSGQCLMSSLIGGRSGNRGRCAQPCRMPYQFYSEGRKVSQEQEKYLLSPKDINTIDNIPELVEAGVNSFKIEGRMKRPEYAAAVAAMYRKYVDYYLELGKDKFHTLLSQNEYEKDMIQLQDVYNRGGFSRGYGPSYHGKSMMSLYRPNHSGVFVGEVSGIKGSKVSIKLREEIHAQDILEIHYKEEDGYEFTVKNPHDKGEILETNVGIRKDASAKISNPLTNIHIGAPVYRTKNNELLNTLSKEYIAEDKKLGVKGLLTAKLGEPLKLHISYGELNATVSHDIVQAAMKQPMTKDKLTAPILKTGDTLYYFNDLAIDMDDNIFVPVSWLNEIRRDAVAKLEEAVVNHNRRNPKTIALTRSDDAQSLNISFDVNEPCLENMNLPSDGNEPRLEISNILSDGDKPSSEIPESASEDLGITVTVQTKEQFKIALGYPEVSQIYAEYDSLEAGALIEMAQKAGKADKKFYISLPQICRLAVYSRLEKELNGIINNRWITGFLVKNFEEISLLRSLVVDGRFKKEIILNYNMYIYNKEAKSFWKENGITHYTAPVELNYQELRQLGTEDCDLLVYGYLPLMVSTQCLMESTIGCKKCKQNNQGYLTDRLGKKFFVQTNCESCYNIIFNGQALALHKQNREIGELKPRNIRLDFSIESPKQMEQIIKIFVNTYRYGDKASDSLTEYTTGHFKRGVE